MTADKNTQMPILVVDMNALQTKHPARALNTLTDLIDAYIENGQKVVVQSNNSRAETAIFLDAMIVNGQLDHRPTNVISCNDLENRDNQQPDFWPLLLKKLHANATDIAFVTDRPQGLIQAEKHGIAGIDLYTDQNTEWPTVALKGLHPSFSSLLIKANAHL